MKAEAILWAEDVTQRPANRHHGTPRPYRTLGETSLSGNPLRRRNAGIVCKVFTIDGDCSIRVGN